MAVALADNTREPQRLEYHEILAECTQTMYMSWKGEDTEKLKSNTFEQSLQVGTANVILVPCTQDPLSQHSQVHTLLACTIAINEISAKRKKNTRANGIKLQHTLTGVTTKAKAISRTTKAQSPHGLRMREINSLSIIVIKT